MIVIKHRTGKATSAETEVQKKKDVGVTSPISKATHMHMQSLERMQKIRDKRRAKASPEPVGSKGTKAHSTNAKTINPGQKDAGGK